MSLAQYKVGSVVDTTNGRVIINSAVHGANKYEWKITFVETGYRTTATTFRLRKGVIKDYMKPKVYGLGYLGESGSNTAGDKAYLTWFKALGRVSRGEATMNPDWYDFRVFREWFTNQNVSARDILVAIGDVLPDVPVRYSTTASIILPSFVLNNIRRAKYTKLGAFKKWYILPNPTKLEGHGPFNTQQLAKDRLKPTELARALELQDRVVNARVPPSKEAVDVMDRLVDSFKPQIQRGLRYNSK